MSDPASILSKKLLSNPEIKETVATQVQKFADLLRTKKGTKELTEHLQREYPEIDPSSFVDIAKTARGKEKEKTMTEMLSDTLRSRRPGADEKLPQLESGDVRARRERAEFNAKERPPIEAGPSTNYKPPLLLEPEGVSLRRNMGSWRDTGVSERMSDPDLSAKWEGTPDYSNIKKGVGAGMIGAGGLGYALTRKGEEEVPVIAAPEEQKAEASAKSDKPEEPGKSGGGKSTDEIKYRTLPGSNPFDAQLDALEKKAKNFSDEKLSEQEKTALQLWSDKNAELKKEYQETKERLGWAQAAEVLGKGLAQLAVGLYGMRTGVDVSGARFSPSDWSKQFDTALAEYKVGLDSEKAKYESAAKPLESLRKQGADLESDITRTRQMRASEQSDREQFDIEQQNRMDAEKLRDAEREAARDSRVQEQDAKKAADLISRAANNQYAQDKQTYLRNTKILMNARKLAEKGDDDDIEAALNILAPILGDDLPATKEKVMDPFFDSNKKKNLDELFATLEQQKVIAPTPEDYLPGAPIYDRLEQAYLEKIGKTKESDVAAPVNTSTSKKQDPRIVKYAEENDIPYEKAKEVLSGRGYKPKE